MFNCVLNCYDIKIQRQNQGGEAFSFLNRQQQQCNGTSATNKCVHHFFMMRNFLLFCTQDVSSSIYFACTIYVLLQKGDKTRIDAADAESSSSLAAPRALGSASPIKWETPSRENELIHALSLNGFITPIFLWQHVLWQNINWILTRWGKMLGIMWK